MDQISPSPLTSIISHANIEKPGSHHLLSIYLLLSYSIPHSYTPMGNNYQL